MAAIKHLPPTVINQIAAGEVIDRPASVVKELIENALDAGATTIEVELVNGGLDLIRVTDNGHGMNVEDLKLCLLKHTTSKITSLKDIERLQSFGFRGEALASMGDVAEISIASRAQGIGRGYQVGKQPGEDPSLPQPYGIAPGTQVALSQLYADVPARRKFLQRQALEVRHVSQVIIHHALLNYQVDFTLKHNDRVLFSFLAQPNLSERTKMVLSPTITANSIPLNIETDLVTISGILGLPQLAKPGNQQQYLYINRRPVSQTHLKRTLNRVYNNLINPRFQPAYIINLDLKPELIDPNTHPRKESVGIMDDRLLAKVVHQELRQALQQPKEYPSEITTSSGYKIADSDTTIAHYSARGKSSAYLATTLKTLAPAWSPESVDPQQIIQYDQLYLVFPQGNKLVVVDQHAAHERILFEQYQQVFRTHQQQLPSQPLAITQELELNPLQHQTVSDHQDQLKKIGFEISAFGDDGYVLRSAPQLLDQKDATKCLYEVLEDVSEGSVVRETNTQTDTTIAYLACRSAVKAGDYLSPPERHKLISKLINTPNYSTCPHGRPTFITMDRLDFDKKFRR